MKYFFIPVIISLFFLCSGCEKKNIIDDEAPKPDFSTPKKALLSYWDYLFWADSLVFSESDLNKGQFFTEKNRKENNVMVFNYRRKLFKSFKSSEKILKTDIYKDTAIICTLKKDTSGFEDFKYKYILTKEPEGWKIKDRLLFCFICKGKGIRHVYFNNSSIPKDVVCFRCKGKGWIYEELVLVHTSTGTYHLLLVR